MSPHSASTPRVVRDSFAGEAAGLLKALAHPARLMICCELKDRELSVSEIEATLGIRQPRLSRELARLREEGLVETRRQSKAVFYRLSDARACAMVNAICAVMQDAATGAAAPFQSANPPAISATATPAPHPPRPNRRGGYGVFARVED